MFKNQKFEQGKADLLHSAMIAKAVLQNPKGGVFIAAVLEKSTRHYFFWLYTAKSARTPRKAWKQAGSFAREQGGYHDFGSFVAYLASLRQARVSSIKVLRAKALRSMQTATLQDEIAAYRAAHDVSKLSTKRVEQKYARGRMGSSAIFHNWKRS